MGRWADGGRSQRETRDTDLQNSPRRCRTRSAYDENRGTGTHGCIVSESSERVIQANRACFCGLFRARSSLIVLL